MENKTGIKIEETIYGWRVYGANGHLDSLLRTKEAADARANLLETRARRTLAARRHAGELR